MAKLSNELIDLRTKRFIGTAFVEQTPEGTVFTIKGTRHEVLQGKNGREELTLVVDFEPDEHGPIPGLTMNGIRKDQLRALFGSLNDEDLVGKQVRLTAGKARARNNSEYYTTLIEGV